MSDLPDGEYLLTDVQWRRQDRDEAFRPLHGFTTGHLYVEGTDAQLEARFNDQFLSNRFSDLEEEGLPIRLIVSVLETEDAYAIAGSAPTLDRSGASYKLKAAGEIHDVAAESPTPSS